CNRPSRMHWTSYFRRALASRTATAIRARCWRARGPAAKLRHCTMHSLRHTFASSLLQDGAAITEVQRYMGHKHASLTLDVYGHFLPTGDSGRVHTHVLRLLGRVGHFVDSSGPEGANGAADSAVSA